MDYYISKRAKENSDEESAFKQWISTVWKTDQGPLQNLFRLAPYASIPIMGLGSIIPMILITVATYILKMSPEDLGRKADEELGLGPGDDPREVPSKIIEYFNGITDKNLVASYEDHQLSKTAGIISGVLRAGKFGKVVYGYIVKFIAVLASMFVFSHLGEFSKKLVNPVREKVTDIKEEYLTEPTEPEELNKKPTSAEEFADYIEQKYGLNEKEPI